MVVDLLNIQPQKVSTDVASYSMLVFGGVKGGKALADSTVIPTVDGEKRISEVKVGDFVFDRTGKPTKVLGVYPQGKQKVYEVHFEDGRVVKSNIDHLWTVVSGHGGRFVTKTLKEIVESGVKVTKTVYGKQKETHPFQVPINEALYFPTKELEYNPYMLGVLIGDGSFKAKQLTISVGDTKQDILKYIAKKTNSESQRNHESNYNYSFKLNEPIEGNNGHTRYFVQTEDIVPEHLIGKLSIEKSLPKDIFEASYEQRLAMLQGLLDTDGTVCGSTLSKIEYSTSSEQLAEDVIKLSRSLGLRTSKISSDRRSDSSRYRNLEYVVAIQTENYKKKELFRFNTRSLKMAEDVYNVKSTRNYKSVKIVDVVETDAEEDMTCLYVDNMEHLFLANDYVVTHNTTFVHKLYGNRVLHVMTEKRYKALAGADVQYVSNWGEYLQVLAQLRKKEVKERYDVISIDTIDNLVPMLEKYVASKYSESAIGERSDIWGADWTDAKTMWRDGMQMIERLGFVPAFVSHSIQNTIQVPKSSILESEKDELTQFTEGTDKKTGQSYLEFLQYQPDIKGKYLAVINNMVDNILYIDSTVDTQGREHRVIHLRGTLQYQAGSTFKDIEPIIPLSPEAYTQAITDAVNKIDNKDKTDVRQADADTSDTKLDFDSLMKEAQVIGTALFKAEHGDKVNAIVEKVFGKEHKLNEATKEQVELVDLVVSQLKEVKQELGV